MEEKNIKYVVQPITEEEIEAQADFGTFKITRTKSAIAYTNYAGYTVITKPYTTTPEGKAGELSLYSWLNYCIEAKGQLSADPEAFSSVPDVTNEDWLESIKIITEANITKPCVVFTDLDYAMQEAVKHIDWLNEMSGTLLDAMSKTPPEEDEKANAEAFGEAVDTENFSNVTENGREQ